MIGTDNELAERHIPELPRRNDTLAGRRGRRSDMCGGWTFMTRDDITRVGPLWLKYTEDVRFDDEVGVWLCIIVCSSPHTRHHPSSPIITHHHTSSHTRHHNHRHGT